MRKGENGMLQLWEIIVISYLNRLAVCMCKSRWPHQVQDRINSVKKSFCTFGWLPFVRANMWCLSFNINHYNVNVSLNVSKNVSLSLSLYVGYGMYVVHMNLKSFWFFLTNALLIFMKSCISLVDNISIVLGSHSNLMRRRSDNFTSLPDGFYQDMHSNRWQYGKWLNEFGWSVW